MLFVHTIDAVLKLLKTQTRRITTPTDIAYAAGNEIWRGNGAISAVYRKNDQRAGRALYVVGSEYAAQPGRGKRALARIQIDNIRREDVRAISDVDVKAEGFEDQQAFWETWVAMHDKQALYAVQKFREIGNNTPGIPWYERGFRVAHDHGDKETYSYTTAEYLATRPAERYTAWCIDFHVTAITADGYAYAAAHGIALPEAA